MSAIRNEKEKLKDLKRKERMKKRGTKKGGTKKGGKKKPVLKLTIPSRRGRRKK